MIVKVKQNENLRQLARAFKNRRHDAILYDTDSVECHGTYWDGGSRSAYAIYNPRTGTIEHIPCPSCPPQFFNSETRERFPDGYPTVPVPDGCYIVECGVFRGKTAHLSVYGPDACEFFGPDEK